MRRIAKLLSVLPVLALGIAACDNADSVTSPVAESRVQTQQTPTQTPTVDTPVNTDDSSQKMIMVDPVMAKLSMVTSAGAELLGAKGGVVDVTNRHGDLVARLVVGAGVVSKPALFTVIVMDNHQVYLAASRYSYNDVGTAGFHKDVRLYFNPNRATPSLLGLSASGVKTTDAPTLAPLGSTKISAPVLSLSNAGSAASQDPNNPPPGDGWVWMDTDMFTGWILLD